MFSLTDYPEFQILQDHCEVIEEELANAPMWFVWDSDAYDRKGNCIFLRGDWTVCPVYFGNVSLCEVVTLADEALKSELGAMCHALPELMPRTTELLSQIPSVNYAAFSRLGPRSSLATHKHKSPCSLILHMGLRIPRHCGLTVAGESHTWQERGDVVIFDGNFPHSAWNFSDAERVVLYVDFENSPAANI